MKKYDVKVQPQHVVFDLLTIWARILSLPNRLTSRDIGMQIAEPIGLVKRIEADSLGRCWGGYMRLRVEIVVDEPFLRAVAVFSSRLNSTASYAVRYERLPLYCFSCGLIGHSSITCACPANRDEDGLLPYGATRISVDEIAKNGRIKVWF
jgi:hypothetical protein